ncbi:MAG: HAD family hydrolase [Eubacterium sp.]|nr:HAD family hydrolase [Eubacterium sp.]
MNGINEIKIVASDLDGTLLLDGAQKLNPEIFDLIRELKKRGILFLAASGRQYANLRRLFAPVQDEIAYLCENGCLSFYRDRIINRELMERDLAIELIDAIQNTDGCEVLVSGVETCYIRPKKPGFLSHMRDVVGNNVTVVDNLMQIPEPYMKVSLFEYGGLDGTGWWQKTFSSRCTVVTGGNEWLDMMPKGVNKSTGFREILRHLQIAPENCVVFGDNDNDLEMLEMAGIPVAMKSAKASVRAAAVFTTDKVEHALEKLLGAL